MAFKGNRLPIVALLDETGTTDAYVDAKVIGELVSNTFTPTYASSGRYADNRLVVQTGKITGGTTSTTVDDLSLENKAFLFGHTYSDGELIVKGSDVSPYLGYGNIINGDVDGEDYVRVIIILKAKLSPIPVESATETEGFDFKTVTYSGVALQNRAYEVTKEKEFSGETAEKDAIKYLYNFFGLDVPGESAVG